MSSSDLAVFSSHQNLRGTRPGYSVLGTDGWVEARGGKSPAAHEECRVHRHGQVQLVPSSVHNAYRHEVADFNATARGGAQFLGNGRDGLAAIVAAIATYESAQTGRTVFLEKVSP